MRHSSESWDLCHGKLECRETRLERATLDTWHRKMQVKLESAKLKYLKSQIIESLPGKNIREHWASYGQLAFKAMQQNGSLWPTKKLCKYLKKKKPTESDKLQCKTAGRQGEQVNVGLVYFIWPAGQSGTSPLVHCCKRRTGPVHWRHRIGHKVLRF